MEEQKRREYEQWFKTQEKEQQDLEYDCSVKYDQRTTTSTNVLEGKFFPSPDCEFVSKRNVKHH